MKIKFFVAGVWLGAKLSNTLAYAFLSGFVYALHYFGQSMAGIIEASERNDQRLADWRRKAEIRS